MRTLNNYVELVNWLAKSPEHRAKCAGDFEHKLYPVSGIFYRRYGNEQAAWVKLGECAVEFPCEAIEPPKPEPEDWEELPRSTLRPGNHAYFDTSRPELLTPTIERICRRIIKEEMKK